MKVHSLLLLAYLVALVAFAASQGVNNGGNSGNDNLGKLPVLISRRPVKGSQYPTASSRSAAASAFRQPWCCLPLEACAVDKGACRDHHSADMI